jgi:hypothetical protein
VTAASPASSLRDPGAARDEARRILAERRFHASRAPHPLRGVFSAIGHALTRLGHALRPLWHPFVSVARAFPGGAWVALGLVAVALAVLVAMGLARRRDRRRWASAHVAGATAGADPAALERAADAAERAGELEEALRLRFRAGVARLRLGHALPASGILTSRELSRTLRSPAFDHAAGLFDEVVYGRRPAQPVDVTTSREAWDEVLRGVRA